MKFKQFSSWFKNAYPDIELVKLSPGLYSISRERNSAIVKDCKDSIVVVVGDSVFKNDLEIVRKFKSLFGYSRCPFKYYNKNVIIKEWPDFETPLDKLSLQVLIRVLGRTKVDLQYEDCKKKNTGPDSIKIRTILDECIEGPVLYDTYVQINPRNSFKNLDYIKDKNEIISVIHDLFL